MSRKPTKAQGAKGTTQHDPSKPLKNLRWEAFAQAVFSGQHQNEAFAAHYKTDRYTPVKVAIKASELRSRPEITARIQYLQENTIPSAEDCRRRLLEYHFKALEARFNGASHFVEALPDGEWTFSFDGERMQQFGEAIQGLDQHVEVTGQGEGGGKEISVVRKPRFRDYLPVSQEIAKLAGAYPATKHELTGKNGGPMEMRVAVSLEGQGIILGGKQPFEPDSGE